MKLIVLYGPENSGKTTTLKMVYEKLKKKNVCEANWFAYYDSDRAHLDFRDVLALDASLLSSIKTSVHSTYVYKGYSDIIFKYIGLCYNVLSGKNDFKVNFDTIEKIETEISKFINKKNSYNVEIFNSFDALNSKIVELEAIDKRHSNIQECKLECGNDLGKIKGYKVGFVLEGDYGFVHSWHKLYAKHTRNLYEHLKQLIGCNTIICACSVLPGPFSYQPLLCILCFIMYCNLKPNPIPLQLVVINSNINNEQNIANRIIQLI